MSVDTLPIGNASSDNDLKPGKQMNEATTDGFFSALAAKV